MNSVKKEVAAGFGADLSVKKSNVPLLTKSIESESDVRDFLKNENTIKIGTDAAVYIQSQLKNWFTMDQFIKKTSYKDPTVAYDTLNLLCLLELCYREEKQGSMKYKIVLSQQAKLDLLYEELKESEEKTAYIIGQIEILTNKISN